MSDELRKRCFDPVVNPHTRLLVLGSLPGEVISGRALLRP
jgi:G:T/U-mismatch repair DNA glycosylase